MRFYNEGPFFKRNEIDREKLQEFRNKFSSEDQLLLNRAYGSPEFAYYSRMMGVGYLIAGKFIHFRACVYHSATKFSSGHYEDVEVVIRKDLIKGIIHKNNSYFIIYGEREDTVEIKGDLVSHLLYALLSGEIGC